MERSKILTAEVRRQLERQPLYSQDGKGGEAVAVMRLFITGTAATFYIIEGQPNGEYEGRENWDLFGVSNMEQGEGFRYDYFSLAELEGLNLRDGLIHVERDRWFTPKPLREIAEVVPSLSELWKFEAEHTAAPQEPNDAEQ